MRARFLLATLALIASAAAASAAVSKDDVQKILDKNPDLVLDVLRQNKKAFFEVVTQAAQEEQARRQKEEEDRRLQEIEARLRDPYVPAVTDKTRVRGKRGAKYTLVEYSDFECPYCLRGHRIVEALRQKYGDNLRVVFKDIPLPFHPHALAAAQWFEAVSLQSPDKAWAFHDKLFENQDKLGEPFYRETAKSLGLDVKRLEKDSQSQAVKAAIEADTEEAKRFGFTGTPFFLLNGVPIHGAVPIPEFDRIIEKIDAAAAKAK